MRLAVGLVVDDAIVVLENIVRHIEMGKKPFEAALIGSREIGFTIISITLSLVAVFIPVFLMGGVVGRVFREFAGTISAAILVSGFVSLTLTPMMCARLLKAHDSHEKKTFMDRLVDPVFNTVLAAYRWSLDLVLKARLLMLIVTLATVAVSVKLYIDVPKGFFPVQDTGVILGISEAPQSQFVCRTKAGHGSEQRDQVKAPVNSDRGKYLCRGQKQRLRGRVSPRREAQQR